MKHTKGPWVADGNGFKKSWDVGGEYSVCEVFTSRADADLISAAPELLEIAKLCVAEWEKPVDGIQKGELIARLSNYADRARAVIKKAEGL